MPEASSPEHLRFSNCEISASSIEHQVALHQRLGALLFMSRKTSLSTTTKTGPVTINYFYDPLNRLTEANYSNNGYYHYTYDAVGNRETQQKSVLSLATNDTYVYDNANRLTSVNGLNYTWDNNGNTSTGSVQCLLNDGVNAYTGVYPEPAEGIPPIASRHSRMPL